MTLNDFPRGGKKATPEAPSNFLFDKKGKLKNKKKKKKVENGEIHIKELVIPNVAECLTFSSLAEGMVILGRVNTFTQYELSISLPGRLNGQVSVTDICQTYTNLLQSLVEGENNYPTEFRFLNELYKRGDYLVCYVKSMSGDAKPRISLSIEPELINQSLNYEKLRKGSKIACSISSKEDHGYVVDTGMTVFRGFLSNKDIDGDVQYYPGQQIFCAIKSLKSIENITTVKLSTKSKHTKSTMVLDQSLDSVIPGTWMTLNIKSVLSNGLQVVFNDGNIGYINQLYLNKPLSSYEQGETIVGKLLYVLPTVKLSYFTELLTDKTMETVKIGDIIEKSKFLYFESNGIILHLAKRVRGFVSFIRTDIDFHTIPSKFIPHSIHKCRVLAYDIFDRTYICTMQRHMLNDKFVLSQNIKAGDKIIVEVVRLNENNGFMSVKFKNIIGHVPPEHIEDLGSECEDKSQIGAKLKARVLGKNKRDNGFLFTLKTSLVNSDLPILSDINNAIVGLKFHGTITRITSCGLLIVFFNNIKGWVSSTNLTKRTGGTLNYSVGQVVVVRINRVDKENKKLSLSLVSDIVKVNKEIKFEIGDAVKGSIIECSIDGIYLKIFQENKRDHVIGFLPAGHIAPCPEIATYLSTRYIPGEIMSAFVFSTSPDFLLTRIYIPREKYTNFNQLQLGDCIPCSIKVISKKSGLKVVLPIKQFEYYGKVPPNKLDNIDLISTHQILFGKIININKKEKKINLTMSSMDIWQDSVEKEMDMIDVVDQLAFYLSKLKELSCQQYYKSKAISSINLGKRVSGVVDKVTEHGLILKLDNDVTGTVRPTHYNGAFKVGDIVKGTVLWINFIHELVDVTLLPMLANTISDKQLKLPQTSLETQLRGEIVLTTNWFVLVALKGQGKGMLVALPSRRHVNDLEPNLSAYTIGKKIRCYIVLNKIESELLPICLIKSAYELRKKNLFAKTKKFKRKVDNHNNDEDLLVKKLKMSPKMMKTGESRKKSIKHRDVETNVKKKRRISEKTEIKTNENEIEIETAFADGKAKEITKIFSIPECGFYWDTKPNDGIITKCESSSESDEDRKSQQAQKKKKKINVTERREWERQKESEIREREEALISNQIPNSVDQFDRLVLASPNSSLVWLQYMAYHLQATEIDKARAIVKRALKTINYREENEKLNVWQAWLNLESRFGTPESLNDVFQQAVNANDSKNIYFHMLSMHAEAGRHVELEKMIKTVTGKFKQLVQMWVEVGTVLLKKGLRDESRHIMQRALQSLVPQEHVNLIVKFAQLEIKFGEKARAHTLFEQILSSYPKRLDVWSAYIDSLIKFGELDAARRILEKAVVQALSPRKMQTLFKKFVVFEEQHGTPQGAERARQLAVAYVEKQCNNRIN